MRLRAAVLTVLTGAALAVPAAPAAAAACTQGSGVTVVVEFASLGGGTQTRCATGDPTSGLAALRGAGFAPTRAAQEPGYFLCRIDGKPANDPCQRTSPANAYWSYWHAKRGGTWTYSSMGPADYDPAPDTVEGWAFGDGKHPSSPPPRRQAAPPRATAASPASSRAPSAAASTVRVAPATSTPAASAAASPVHIVPSATSPITSGTLASSGASATTKAAPPDPPPGTVISRPNKYAGPVAAGVLVLLIVAAGMRRLRMRRRKDGD